MQYKDLCFSALNGVDDILTRLEWIKQTLFMILEHLDDAEGLTAATRNNDTISLLAFARRWPMYDAVLHGLWVSLDDLMGSIDAGNRKDWERYFETDKATA